MNKLKSYAASRRGRDTLLSFGIVIAAFIIVQALIAGGMISSQIKGLLVPICAYVVMAISLNMTVGILGELSLGHAGFMSVGAFAGIVTTTCLADAIPLAPLRLAVAMIVGAAFAALAGVIVGVPVLRLKGDYLAIVTLAFGEIIKNIVNVMYLGRDADGLHFSLVEQKFQLGDGGKMIINGPIGVSGVAKISTFTSGVVLILVTLFFVLNFINSRTGRAVMAVRDNKIAAGAARPLPRRSSTSTPLSSCWYSSFWAVSATSGARSSRRRCSRCCLSCCAAFPTTACSSTRSC